MPRSLIIVALLFALAGISCLAAKFCFGFFAVVPTWVAVWALVAGCGLFLGQPWGRFLASLMILVGYVAAVVGLISAVVPAWGNMLAVWEVYGWVLLAVAFLTFMSGTIWSRSVSIYLDRFPRKTRH